MSNIPSPIRIIDSFLLDGTRTITSFIQRTFGPNNFDLARFIWLFLVATEIGRTVVAGFFLNEHGKTFGGIFGFLCSLLWPRWINEAQLACKPTFLNPIRESSFHRTVRFVILYMTVAGSLELFLVSYSSMAEYMHSRFSYAVQPCVISILYLMSVEPDPPSESKLRQLGRKLKTFFVPTPAALPA